MSLKNELSDNFVLTPDLDISRTSVTTDQTQAAQRVIDSAQEFRRRVHISVDQSEEGSAQHSNNEDTLSQVYMLKFLLVCTIQTFARNLSCSRFLFCPLLDIYIFDFFVKRSWSIRLVLHLKLVHPHRSYLVCHNLLLIQFYRFTGVILRCFFIYIHC